jgi:hypothetical protein
MSPLGLLLIVFLLLMIFGNPHVGPRVYPGYSYGYFPGIIGLIVVIVLLFMLFGNGGGHSFSFR